MSYEDPNSRNEKDNNVEIWKIKKLIKVRSSDDFLKHPAINLYFILEPGTCSRKWHQHDIAHYSTKRPDLPSFKDVG
jgi:hypothetical protein